MLLDEQGDAACLHCVQVVLVLCRCLFCLREGWYVSVILRLVYLTGKGRVVAVSVPAVWA